MNSLEELFELSGPTLVAVRQHFTELHNSGFNIIFATISPNPHVKIETRRVWGKTKINCKIPYGKLPQRLQFDYCIRMFKSSYNYSEDATYFITWELNKTANIHLHILMCDPYIQSSVMLDIFRRDVLNSEMVFKNLSKSMIDYCNNIVFVTDSIKSRIDYLIKDNNCGLPFPYYFSKSIVKGEKGGSSLGTLVPSGASEGVDEISTTNQAQNDFNAVYIKDLDEICFNNRFYKSTPLQPQPLMWETL